MYVNHIQYTNFRNLEDSIIHFEPGFVVMAGENGMGKTNFLEAIYFGATTRKFPDSKIIQLLKNEQNFFRVQLQFTKNTAEQINLETFYQLENNRFMSVWKINSQKQVRTRYADALPVISFLPEDLNLLTHSPASRRRFLDESLSAANIKYRYNILNYEKVLRQRGELLWSIKEGRGRYDDLGVWDEQFSEFGRSVTRQRTEYIDFINHGLGQVLRSIAPELQGVGVLYKNSGAAEKEQFREALRNQRSREVETGTVAIGPHRDDFSVLLGGHEVPGYVSRGQLRSLTLALKISQRDYLVKELGATPVILLDDVFSEFDRDHRQKVVEFLKTFDQVFFTSTNLDEIIIFLPKQTQIYNVKNGEIKIDG